MVTYTQINGFTKSKDGTSLDVSLCVSDEKGDTCLASFSVAVPKATEDDAKAIDLLIATESKRVLAALPPDNPEPLREEELIGRRVRVD